uniref:Uncharacterized protein n=1 Tax=Arundo donax TaxID=35708 RepID=A0A0A9CWI8_ARUDO
MLPVPASRACRPSAKQYARRCVASPCGVACCLICLSSSVALRRSSVATACAQWMSRVRRSTTSLPPRRPLAFPFPAFPPASFLAASSCMAIRSFCICSTHISWEGIMTLSNMSRAASSSPSTALCLLLLPPSISSSSSSYRFLRPRPAPPPPGTRSTASFFTLTATAAAAGGARARPLIPDASLSSPFWKSTAEE